MDRTTVMLPAKLKERARAEAKKEGISLGEFVRRSVEHEVAHPVSKLGPHKKLTPTRAQKPQRRFSPAPDLHLTGPGSASSEKVDVADLYDIYF